MPSGAHASCGAVFREKLIDVLRRFSKSREFVLGGSSVMSGERRS
jgi:hypothetical protein